MKEVVGALHTANRKFSDESEYWPGRNEAALRQNVREMNCVIPGAAGATKDFERAKGAAGVQSRIFAHPQFEHLEAEGPAREDAAACRRRNTRTRIRSAAARLRR
jgi:hypothetical protein